MSNSGLLRIKNKQKAPYKKQKTASSYYNYTLNGLMTDLGLFLNYQTGIKNQKETAFSDYKLLQVTSKKYIFARFSKLRRSLSTDGFMVQ